MSSTSKKNDINDNTKPFVMTKKNIREAAANSYIVNNTKEAYQKYFNLGGTVSKMTTDTTKRYIKFKRNQLKN